MPQAPPTAAGPSPTSLLSRFLNEHLPLQVLETQGPQDPSPSLTPGILMGQPGLSNVTRQRYPEQRWGRLQWTVRRARERTLSTLRGKPGDVSEMRPLELQPEK